MPTEMEINNLINKHLVDKFTATDDLLGMLLKLQFDNNNLLSHIININLNNTYNENQDYTNLDINNNKIFAGNYGVTLGNAESSDLVTCVINGRPIVCIAKSDVGQYERVIVVPGGSDTEPHVVALGILIKGNYEGTPKVVATDESGNLISEIVGSEGIPVLQNVIGALISEMQGSEGIAVKQEATGELVSVIQGSEGVEVKQNVDGKLVTEMQGSEDLPVKQKATGELISVMQGAEGVDVAQDSTGAFESVMKGIDSDGDLQTAALDANGKFEMYIYDQSDQLGIVNTIGLSELAQRIGTPLVYDKRGQIVWYDNFESPVLKWTEYTLGSGSAIALDTAIVHEGTLAVKLTAGAAIGRYATISRQELYKSTSNIGISLSFSIQTANAIIEIESIYRDTSATNVTRIKYDKSADELFILNSSNTWTLIDTIKIQSGAHIWGNLKFVIDWSTRKYIRCIFQNKQYDLSSYDIYSFASGNVGIVSTVSFKVTSGSTSEQIVYFDKVIITTNEPEN